MTNPLRTARRGSAGFARSTTRNDKSDTEHFKPAICKRKTSQPDHRRLMNKTHHATPAPRIRRAARRPRAGPTRDVGARRRPADHSPRRRLALKSTVALRCGARRRQYSLQVSRVFVCLFFFPLPIEKLVKCSSNIRRLNARLDSDVSCDAATRSDAYYLLIGERRTRGR